MRRAREKLKSARGASLALTLLLLLVCMAVGASLLTASASNGGRVRGSRQERQGYLVLSSAAELVTGDLTKMDYHGNYAYAPREEKTVPNAGGGSEVVVTPASYTLWEGDAGSDSRLGAKLLPVLDGIFARALRAQASAEGAAYSVKTGTPQSAAPHTDKWTVSAAGAGAFDPLGGFEVTAAVTVDENYVIDLSFTITGAPEGYQEDMFAGLAIRARLTPLESPPAPHTTSGAGGVCQSTPLTWTLDWMSDRGEGAP